MRLSRGIRGRMCEFIESPFIIHLSSFGKFEINQGLDGYIDRGLEME